LNFCTAGGASTLVCPNNDDPGQIGAAVELCMQVDAAGKPWVHSRFVKQGGLPQQTSHA